LPLGKFNFSGLPNVQTGYGAQPDTGFLSPLVKRSGREANHSMPLFPLFAFRDRDIFTCTLWSTHHRLIASPL